MIKVNPIRTMAVTAALAASTAVLAHNPIQRQKNTFLTEKYIKANESGRDEFVSQKNLVSEVTSDAVKKITRGENSANTDFDKAVDYYNKSMDYQQRYAVTKKTYENLQTRLYNMEKAIDQAYIDCEAYGDIMIVPRWHYRFYPSFDTRLINFDLEDLRTRTAKDMESLYELKDKIEYIMEEANGKTEHTTPDKTEYDVDKLAQKHLKMSYEEFAEKYKDELEFCKTVTYADLYSMNETQKKVYAQAKAYAKEMLEITTNEAHTVNWNVGELKVNEALKASEDMLTISDFEDDGITEEGLKSIQSGIMYKAFEDALTAKYKDLAPTGMTGTTADGKSYNAVKKLVDGKVLILNPNGSVYDINGHLIK